MKRNILIIVICILLAGAGVAWYFFGRPGVGPDGNLANRAPLPQSHALTGDEKRLSGIPEGIEGTVKYDYQEDGSVYSYLEVTSDTRVLDTDTDGIPDDQEASHGTDPANPDTDVDGWRDGDEVAKGSDPTKKDTDGDGLNDYDEFTVYQSDPAKTDTDGDGFNDGAEVEKGFSPIGPGKL